MIKLYNGDAITKLKKIASNSVDLIVTDPPYRMTARGNHGNSGGMLAKSISM